MSGLGGSSRCEDVAMQFSAEAAWLGGCTVIVTGSNSGIGLEAAKQCAKLGATVVMACRSVEKAETARNAVVQEIGEKAKLVCMKLDLGDLESVDGFAKSFLASSKEGNWPPLRVVVANAGIFPSKSETSKQGFTMGFAANHLGHFALIKLLLPTLRANQPSKVVVVSSDAHYQQRKSMESRDELLKAAFSDSASMSLSAGAELYGSTKLMNVLFARALNAKESANGVRAVSLHPGNLIPTDVTRDLNAFLRFFAHYIVPLFAKTINQGTSTTMRCVLLPHDEMKGQYFASCQEKKPSKLVTDAAAQSLWDFSEEMLSKHSSKI